MIHRLKERVGLIGIWIMILTIMTGISYIIVELNIWKRPIPIHAVYIFIFGTVCFAIDTVLLIINYVRSKDHIEDKI